MARPPPTCPPAAFPGTPNCAEVGRSAVPELIQSRELADRREAPSWALLGLVAGEATHRARHSDQTGHPALAHCLRRQSGPRLGSPASSRS